jgi:hypothetical protein
MPMRRPINSSRPQCMECDKAVNYHDFTFSDHFRLLHNKKKQN